MSFTPIVGNGGYSGWRLLNRTADQQKALVARDAGVQRQHAYFRENIGKVKDADGLVGDYRLLHTALNAFGLENDLNSRAFIRKVLESDPADPKSLVNRLPDKRYKNFAEAFQLAKNGDAVRKPGFADAVIARDVSARFEQRVGDVDNNLRLALNARRELAELGASKSNDNTKWYTVLGSKALREVVQTAFGLSKDFAKIPVDRQLDELKAKSDKVLGSRSASVFSDPAAVEKVVQRFLIRAPAGQTVQSPISRALTLLGG